MRILFINSSPHPHGNISQMLALMRQKAESLGATTTFIEVSRLKIHPCTGCMKCRTSLTCSLPADDAHHAVELLHQADTLVIGAPCYWGNMPGTLKLLFDRMVYGLVKKGPANIPQPLHKGKKAIIVTACTTPYPFSQWLNQTSGVRKALKEILKWSGFKLVKCIEKAGTQQHAELTPREAKICQKAIERLF